jgi:amidase
MARTSAKTGSWLSACEMAGLVERGEVSGPELVDAAIERLEDAAQLNVLVSDRFELARREAREQGPDAGPFRGVPILVKDLGCAIEGDVDYMGSAPLREVDCRAPAGSALTRRLMDAGFVILGRTTTPEFGIRSTTESRATGQTANPWGSDRSTGGSSGGSAAAVAAGLVPIGQGSDGAGSLRMPASLCGVVTLKPSRGRISPAPEGQVMMGHSEYGPLARSVRDVAAFLDVASGPEPGDPAACPPPARPFGHEHDIEPKRLRIGTFLEPSLAGVAIDSACTDAVRAVAAVLEGAGHEVSTEFPAAYDDELYLDHFIDTIAPTLGGVFAFVGERIGRPIGEADVEPQTWYWYRRGQGRSGADLADDLIWLDGYRRRMAAWWASGFDLLVAPSFPLAKLHMGLPEDGGEGTRRNINLIRVTAPFNTTGQPALTVPSALADGVPVGVQLVAAYGREDLLLQVGGQLEEAIGWGAWRPDAGG